MSGAGRTPPGRVTHAAVFMKSGAVVEVITDDDLAGAVTLRARRFGLVTSEAVDAEGARRLGEALLAAAGAQIRAIEAATGAGQIMRDALAVIKAVQS